MRLRRFTIGRVTDLRIERKACFLTEKMDPREWERLKIQVNMAGRGGGGRAGAWGGGVACRNDPWSKILEEQEESGEERDGRVGLRHKKNASSSKIIAKEVRIDDEMCGFVRVQ